MGSTWGCRDTGLFCVAINLESHTSSSITYATILNYAGQGLYCITVYEQMSCVYHEVTPLKAWVQLEHKGMLLWVNISFPAVAHRVIWQCFTEEQKHLFTD